LWVYILPKTTRPKYYGQNKNTEMWEG